MIVPRTQIFKKNNRAVVFSLFTGGEAVSVSQQTERFD